MIFTMYNSSLTAVTEYFSGFWRGNANLGIKKCTELLCHVASAAKCGAVPPPSPSPFPRPLGWNKLRQLSSFPMYPSLCRARTLPLPTSISPLKSNSTITEQRWNCRRKQKRRLVSLPRCSTMSILQKTFSVKTSLRTGERCVGYFTVHGQT